MTCAIEIPVCEGGSPPAVTAEIPGRQGYIWHRKHSFCGGGGGEEGVQQILSSSIVPQPTVEGGVESAPYQVRCPVLHCVCLLSSEGDG